MCPLSANRYNIDFLSFRISNHETKETLFEISKGLPTKSVEFDMGEDSTCMVDEDNFRRIKYTFSEDVIRLPLIATS